MRKIVYLSLIIVAAVALFQLGCREQSDRKTAVTRDHVQSVVLPVKGMSCSVCVGQVRKCLNSVKGVTDVNVSLKDANARIQYLPEKTSPHVLVETINKCGYKSEEPAVR